MSQASDAIDELQVQVEADTTVKGSAITLMSGLKAQLDAAIAELAAAGADVARLRAMSAALGSNTQALADSIIANTPAADPGP